MDEHKINVWVAAPGTIFKAAYLIGVGLGVGALTVLVAFIMFMKAMDALGLSA